MTVMKEVKVGEVSGAALDYLVLTCEELDADSNITTKQFISMQNQGYFLYSTDWEQGGPIIDREKIDLFTEKGTPESWMASIARYQNGERLVGWRIHKYGPTPLIAVMRCYVSSVLGDQVEVPDELI